MFEFITKTFAAGVCGVATSLACATEPVDGRPPATDLLNKADAYRQIYDNSLLKIRLVNDASSSPDKENTLTVLLKGNDKALISSSSGVSASQTILMTEDGVWVKLAHTSKVIRITPIQRLLGQASYGDVGRLRWVRDYRVEYQADAQRRIDGVDVWALDLTSITPHSVYAKIALYVARDNGRPVQAAFYLSSGKLFKTAFYDKPQKVGSRMMIRRTKFVDAMVGGNTTEMIIDDVEPRVSPDRIFTQESLAQ